MDTTEIATFLEDRSEAIRSRDLDRLLSFYAPDIVYFDVVPPLYYAGIEAMRGRFADWFARWAGPIGQDVRDLHVEAGGDVAAAHMLIRTSGTLAAGPEVGYWVRATDVLRRAAGGWAIAHEHVSLPVEFPAGTAAMDLKPTR
ncbi:YybH family protein [Jiangella mangrovi]|uniref:Ketosteroid isomerase-like protein n=1 Tax=Jiangella mangrovi TaxID=1524084 RepID=A0A7W9GQD1_9ACTN|nr:nuclear transport factor 2 family protein [Jiangella mangrovi]MBB5787957.1 ketosteroid isomerase-like protein [Jiangella mangrovi]